MSLLSLLVNMVLEVLDNPVKQEKIFFLGERESMCVGGQREKENLKQLHAQHECRAPSQDPD